MEGQELVLPSKEETGEGFTEVGTFGLGCGGLSRSSPGRATNLVWTEGQEGLGQFYVMYLGVWKRRKEGGIMGVIGSECEGPSSAC